VVATSPPAYTQGGTYAAALDRLHQFTADALAHQSLTFAAREGCFVGRLPAVSNPSAWNVTVGPCAGLVTNDSAASVGDYKWCNPSNASVTLTASSGTLNRIDLIGVQIKDNFLDSSGLNSATVAVVQGTSVSGTASPPAVPNSFIPLSQASVPAGSSNPTLSSIAARTGAQGIVLPVANAADRALTTAPYDGMAIWRIDRKWLEVFSAATGGWIVVGGALASSTADAASVITSPQTGQRVYVGDIPYYWDGAAWVVEPGQVLAGQFRSTLSAAITNTETQVLSVTVTLDRNSTFILKFAAHAQVSNPSNDFDMRIRDTNLTGTILLEKIIPRNLDAYPVGDTAEVIFQNLTGAPVTKTFVASIQRVVGTGSYTMDTASTFLTVTKVAPSGRFTSV
jgi:hypothetical protein